MWCRGSWFLLNFGIKWNPPRWRCCGIDYYIGWGCWNGEKWTPILQWFFYWVVWGEFKFFMFFGCGYYCRKWMLLWNVDPVQFSWKCNFHWQFEFIIIKSVVMGVVRMVWVMIVATVNNISFIWSAQVNIVEFGAFFRSNSLKILPK